LSLGHSSFYGIHDLPTEVFGIGFHKSMMTCSPSSSQHPVAALSALCGPNLVPMIATDEETVASSNETHNKVFFTFAPPFQEVTEYCIPAQATSQPLFTGVPRRGILRISSNTISANFAITEV
jgi:hypothetical protein